MDGFAQAFQATIPAIQGLVASMADVNMGLRRALQDIRRRLEEGEDLTAVILPEPFRSVHLIVDSTGDAYDEDHNFLLTLDPDGINDLMKILDYVELRTALDGDIIQVAHRFG